MVVFITVFRPICEKSEKWKSLVFFLLLSIVLEVVCSITNLPDTVYRLLCIRYIFLIWVGWIWVKDGIKLNALTIGASLLSLAAIVYFAYFSKDLEPLFYNTLWVTHRWICYFWVGFAFVGLLHWIYKKVSRYERINRAVKMLASASYEIFLAQMAVYSIYYVIDTHFPICNLFLQGLSFTVVFLLSIFGGIIIKRICSS